MDEYVEEMFGKTITFRIMVPAEFEAHIKTKPEFAESFVEGYYAAHGAGWEKPLIVLNDRFVERGDHVEEMQLAHELFHASKGLQHQSWWTFDIGTPYLFLRWRDTFGLRPVARDLLRKWGRRT